MRGFCRIVCARSWMRSSILKLPVKLKNSKGQDLPGQPLLRDARHLDQIKGSSSKGGLTERLRLRGCLDSLQRSLACWTFGNVATRHSRRMGSSLAINRAGYVFARSRIFTCFCRRAILQMNDRVTNTQRLDSQPCFCLQSDLRSHCVRGMPQ